MPDLQNDPTLVDEQNIDRKLHAERVDPFRWRYPKPFAWLKTCMFQQPGPASLTGISHGHSFSEDGLPR